MESPGLVILSILGFGALFVLLPVALVTLSEHRRPRSIRCPETDGPASVQVDARRAARGALFGRSSLRVEACSLWPEKAGCAQACVASSAGAAVSSLSEPSSPGSRG